MPKVRADNGSDASARRENSVSDSGREGDLQSGQDHPVADASGLYSPTV